MGDPQRDRAPAVTGHCVRAAVGVANAVLSYNWKGFPARLTNVAGCCCWYYQSSTLAMREPLSCDMFLNKNQ
jgi:hypothetical protein